jgi:uncharacterized membrane protein YraQ (UPF0718 family)
VFSEVERELKLCLDGFSWLARWLTGMYQILIVLCLYVVLSFVVLYLANPFLHSLTRADIREAWRTVFLMLGSGLAFATLFALQKSFPLLRFYGRYYDSTRRPRAALSIIVFSVIFPIAVRWFYEQLRR